MRKNPIQIGATAQNKRMLKVSKVESEWKSREGVLKRFFTPSERKQFRTPREERIMSEKLRLMPDTRMYASSHVMINKHRVSHYLPELERSGYLDEIATNHAKKMSEKGNTILSLDERNIAMLQQNFDPQSRFSLNVSSGSSIREIQKRFMKFRTPRSNILSPNINMMGVGSAVDSKNNTYVCQLFVGQRNCLILF